MKDPIYIIGAGAIGKTLAVFLKLKNEDVTILRGSVDDQPNQAETITVVSPDGKKLTATVDIRTLSDFTELNGIIVLTNKSYGNDQLSVRMKKKGVGSPVVLLQNGLGVERPFIDGGFAEIYRCVLFVTCQFSDANTIRFKPVTASPIGIIKGTGSRLTDIVDQLTSTQFPFKSETDIQPVIWKKAIINSVFNSICPLLNIDNGVFHREEAALKIARRVISECVAIAKLQGIDLDETDTVENLLLISRSSDGQLISTLQDINHQRETEINTLNLEIARLAGAINKEQLIKETRLLGELTKLKSDLNRAN